MIIHNVFNFWTTKVDVRTFPGEELCPKCKGRGTNPPYHSDNLILFSPTDMCSLCKGEGKIDWIQKAMGIK